MKTWPGSPSVYEINTWVWLGELTRKYGTLIALDSVPPAEWDALAAWGFDAVWLMGVWERSPEGARIAREHPGLQADYRRALPDYTGDDVIGSPYCIRRYDVDPHLGGRKGLAAARQALTDRGLRLLLDFVPNHTARDHSWVDQHPDCYVQGTSVDAANTDAFFERNGYVIALGRDPYFPPWTDVAQLNAFHPALRQAATQTLLDIAGQCDGVRCDMAMLLINRIFADTWGDRAGPQPQTEFWPDVIPAVKALDPEFLFIAETYWDLEWELQHQGFDFCYDKRLYDRLTQGDAVSIQAHLSADLSYQHRLVRFLENHDEPRAATMPPPRHRAAALAIATLPGAKLWHEGQFEGRKVRLPVQLGRRPEEPVDIDLQAFYRALLRIVRKCRDDWRLSNEGDGRILAWAWASGERTVINFSGDFVRDLPPWFGHVLKRAFATTA
jgi:glycosidase